MLGNLYVIGPVTGKPNDNRPAFYAARCDLKACGYYVQTPMDFIHPGTPWNEAMTISINVITSYECDPMEVDCAPVVNKFDGVATLPGWEDSPGARLEAQVAEAIGLPVKTVAEWVEVASCQ